MATYLGLFLTLLNSAYKTDDKNILLANQLTLEANYNNLAIRLAHHKRPEFVPPPGTTLKDVEKALSHLEKVEQERSVALHAELNRQIRLQVCFIHLLLCHFSSFFVFSFGLGIHPYFLTLFFLFQSLAAQHKSVAAILQKWCTDKELFLNTHPIIDSVSSAQLALRLLEAFVKESAAARGTTLRHLHAMGDELAKERFEFIAAVRALEKGCDTYFDKLDGLAKARAPVLQDDLTRETYKQTVKLLHKEYNDRYEAVKNGWVMPKKAYLTTFEPVFSVAEVFRFCILLLDDFLFSRKATTFISLLDAYETERVVSGEHQLADLRTIRDKLFAAEHESQYVLLLHL